MIDHMSLTVRDFGRSKEFYRRALEPLGFSVQMEFEGACGMGTESKPFFWLHQGEVGRPAHFAFSATERPRVDAFHQAALAAGATDNGAPGIRQDYHPNYYAAFVFDPDGNNVEAVCHLAPDAGRRAGGARKRAAARGAPRKAARGGVARRTARKGARKPARGKPARKRR